MHSSTVPTMINYPVKGRPDAHKPAPDVLSPPAAIALPLAPLLTCPYSWPMDTDLGLSVYILVCHSLLRPFLCRSDRAAASTLRGARMGKRGGGRGWRTALQEPGEVLLGWAESHVRAQGGRESPLSCTIPTPLHSQSELLVHHTAPHPTPSASNRPSHPTPQLHHYPPT